jgi:hypothetical protein
MHFSERPFGRCFVEEDFAFAFFDYEELWSLFFAAVYTADF